MAFLTSCWLIDLAIVFFTGFVTVYFYFKKGFQTWNKRGFPMPSEPAFPSGHFPGLRWSRSIDRIAADIYKSTPNDKVVGTYIYTEPTIIVRDMEVVKDILVKDFAKFHDRGFDLDPKRDPLVGHLFALNGQEWRNLRIKLTPTFTSGKMKMMFNTLKDVGKSLNEAFEESTKSDEVEVKDILARFTTDVISSVAFGVETNSLKNPNAEFRVMSKDLSKPSLHMIIMNFIILICPKLVNYLPIRVIPKYISDFFIRIVRETMEYRIENNIHRNDFMQLLLQLKTLGYVKDADAAEKDLKPETQQKFSIEEAAAQAFLFFFAGFETSSATMQFALYELAVNPELQKKLQEEIDQVKAQNNGDITYEALMKMDLLDRVVAETLRKYPVAAALMRQCNEEYAVPGTDLKILPKDRIFFPIYGYHHDPEFYPDPEKFDPDRFLPEVKETRPHYAYMPFGEGPRNCIGNRFGLMQTKTGLAFCLSRFTFSPSKRTPIPMVLDPAADILSPKGGMHLKVSLRK